MTTCRSCNAEVVFVPSAKTGRAMILNAKPTKGVVVATAVNEHGGAHAFASRAIVADPSLAVGIVPQAIVVDVYTDHHATCPFAESFRGRR